ncbi:MAG: serine kinase [Bacillota bacterium]
MVKSDPFTEIDLSRAVKELELELITGDINKKAEGIYICDLLSNVIASARSGDIWLTVQAHMNILAVADLTDVAAVVIVEDNEPDQATVDKAAEKGITLLKSSKSAFELGIDLNYFSSH